MPWYEAICVAYRALECVTLDYNVLKYDHPNVTTITVKQFEAEPPEARSRFDVVWSISSFEHNGLGRYGDPLAPDGDVEAMLAMHRHLSAESKHRRMYLSVPVGQDAVGWNAGRVYGEKRLPYLIEGGEWRVEKSFGFDPPKDLKRASDWDHQVRSRPPPTPRPSTDPSPAARLRSQARARRNGEGVVGS